jgi:DNA polymerase III subunit delta'
LQRLITTSSSGGYRVCIVDSADDLNTSSANALLKMIEEPPARTLFLLISHRPGRLLPTIRSRCRRLMLSPLSESDVREALNALGSPWADYGDKEKQRACELAEGSVARAMGFLRPQTYILVTTLHAMLDKLPHIDVQAAFGFAETLNGKTSADDLAIVLDATHQWVSRRVRDLNHEPAARILPLVEAWDTISQEAQAAITYHLDKRPLVLSLLERLAYATRMTTTMTSLAHRGEA